MIIKNEFTEFSNRQVKGLLAITTLVFLVSFGGCFNNAGETNENTNTKPTADLMDKPTSANNTDEKSESKKNEETNDVDSEPKFTVKEAKNTDELMDAMKAYKSIGKFEQGELIYTAPYGSDPEIARLTAEYKKDDKSYRFIIAKFDSPVVTAAYAVKKLKDKNKSLKKTKIGAIAIYEFVGKNYLHCKDKVCIELSTNPDNSVTEPMEISNTILKDA